MEETVIWLIIYNSYFLKDLINSQFKYSSKCLIIANSHFSKIFITLKLLENKPKFTHVLMFWHFNLDSLIAEYINTNMQ